MPTVTAAWCTGGDVEAEFMRSWHETFVHDRTRRQLLDEEYIDVLGGPRLHVMRTEAVRRFLSSSDAEWLWFLDTDMAWAPEQFYELFDACDAERAPIVGALCFGTSRTAGGLFPTVYDRDENGRLCARLDPPRALEQCDATGFAFVLVHRGVLERMAAPAPAGFGTRADGFVDLLPWFCDGQVGDVLMEGDLAFCARARALDIPVHVHGGVPVLHKKPAMHGVELFDAVLEMQRTRGLA